MKNKIISIVVPVYNVEQYLRKCINSLLMQSYKNVEIILVDDGSTDNSGTICDAYAENNKNVLVFHKKNSGLSDARNFGIEKASGEYIYLIDSDDYLMEKDSLEILFSSMIEFDADIVLGAYCEDRSGDKCLFVENSRRSFILSKEQAIKNSYDYSKYKSIFVVAHNKLYRRDIFKTIKYPKGKLHEDEFTTYKIYLKAKKIVYIDYTTYAYVIRENSIMTSNYSLKRMDVLEAIEERIKILEENNIPTNDTKSYYCSLLGYHKFMLKKYGYFEVKIVEKKIRDISVDSTMNLKLILKILLLKYFDKFYFKCKHKL